MRELRTCLGAFATGVTIVTCRDAEDRPCGITVNSFSSVSLDPPLVLWNIAKSSNSLDAFLSAGRFAIHVLTIDQLALSVHFSRTDHTRFDDIRFEDSAHRVPLLPDCLAVLECSSHAVHDSGDHHIIIGHVDSFRSDDDGAAPLLFFGGRYRSLGGEKC